MLLSQFVRGSTRALQALYPEAEASALVAMLVEELTGFRRYTHIIEPQTEVPGDKEALLEQALARLCAGEPIQYVLGYTEFCGLKLKVAPGVLIPRPETEMLVEQALRLLPPPSADPSSPGARVLDLCTGSGCIAWALATRRPDLSVTAVDLSPDALALASSQKAFLGTSATVDFYLADVLSDPPAIIPTDPSAVIPSDLSVISTKAEGRVEESLYDLIVSNPPYIKDSERASMRPNVLDHEPAMALFVPDADPLRFYRAIARWAQALLAPGGRGLVEINETLGPGTAAVFTAAGFTDVAVLPDFAGKDRFVSFSRP